eukprot:14189476-Heterocapsa_arctica.AAC.1
MQEHHDNKWKYRNKALVNNIDTDEEHRSTPAEIIDFVIGDPTMDANTLAKGKGGKRHLDMPNKSKNGVDKRGHCEPEKAGERPGYQSRNYNK